MDKKIRIEKNTVQETLVIPLYGRKLCTELFPDLFQDKKAVGLIDRMEKIIYDKKTGIHYELQGALFVVPNAT